MENSVKLYANHTRLASEFEQMTLCPLPGCHGISHCGLYPATQKINVSTLSKFEKPKSNGLQPFSEQDHGCGAVMLSPFSLDLSLNVISFSPTVRLSRTVILIFVNPNAL